MLGLRGEGEEISFRCSEVTSGGVLVEQFFEVVGGQVVKGGAGF